METLALENLSEQKLKLMRADRFQCIREGGGTDEQPSTAAYTGNWPQAMQQFEESLSASKEKKRGHIAVFQGVTPNIGTTVLSFGCAMQLAQATEGKVAYVCLNLKSSKLHHYCGMVKPAVSLDEIRAELKSASLTAEGLRARFHRLPEAPQLSILFGNMLREQAEYYTIEDIEYLLSLCREAFDMTIVEVGAYWDNAAVFSAMLEADARFLVCTNRLGSFQEDYRRWSVPMMEALQIESGACCLVVTQIGAASGYRLPAIRKQTGLKVVGSLSSHPAVELMLDQGRLHELVSGAQHHPIVQELQEVTRLMIGLGKLTQKPRSGMTRLWYHKLFPVPGR